MDASLYVAKGGGATTSSLYVVDFTPGSDYTDCSGVTEIGPMGFAVTGLAFDPTTRIMYGITSQNSAANPLSLIRIDIDTGAGTLIGPETGPDTPWTDITFDASGQMFAFAKNVRLYLVNKATGVGTLVAAVSGYIIAGTVGGALAYDLTDDQLWLANGNGATFYQLDPATAAAIARPFDPLSFRIPAMDFLPGTDFSYLIRPDLTPTQLRRISVSGSPPTDLVGPLLADADGLAWVPPLPPPPTNPVFLGRFRASGD